MKNLSKAGLVLAMAFFLTISIASCSPKDPPEINGIGVDAVSVSQINIWLSGNGHTDGFRIERSTDGIFYFQIADVSYNSDLGYSTYEDKGLASETYYYYQARAYNGHDQTDYFGPVATKTFMDGFGMCVVKTSTADFPCMRTRCQHEMNSSSMWVGGTEVFDCLGVQLTAPATMTVSFDYAANAMTCFDQPSLQVTAGTQVQTFSFDCSSAKATAAITIGIVAGQTINDINFGLNSGDWGSTVCIKSITFAP